MDHLNERPGWEGRLDPVAYLLAAVSGMIMGLFIGFFAGMWVG